VEYREGEHLRAQDFARDELGTDPAFLDLVRRGGVETIHSREASLDDVFVQITGGRL
jgi:fluoroquinolone transport system ATP-binding protein